MKYCMFCGYKIPPQAKFCQICGKEQPEGAEYIARPDELAIAPVADAPDAPSAAKKISLKDAIGKVGAGWSKVGGFIGSVKNSPIKMAIVGLIGFLILLVVMTIIAIWLLK